MPLAPPPMCRRVLIVTSSYRPTLIADMHRARLLAWDLPGCGWEVHMLAPGVEFQRRDCFERDAEPLFNPAVPFHEVSGGCARFWRCLGVQTIGWRAFLPLHRKGLALLQSIGFDLVYITTAHFILFCLGPLWQRLRRVPYVLDFHDPWVRDGSPTIRGNWKRAVNAPLSTYLERLAVSYAAGLVSVSPNYLAALRARHPKAPALAHERSVILPFPARAQDLPGGSECVPWNRSRAVLLSIGAGGPIMAESFRRFLTLLRKVIALDPGLGARIQVQLHGTESGWQPGQSTVLAEIAAREGFSDLVEECPARVPYRSALGMMSRAAGLIVLGVDDPAYMPSKLFTCALTGKPLLACLHRASQAASYFANNPGLGRLIRFHEPSSADGRDLEQLRLFLDEALSGKRHDRTEVLRPYLSETAARDHAAFFTRLLAGDKS